MYDYQSIVSRLRNFAVWNARHSHYDPVPLCKEAADLIERITSGPTEPLRCLRCGTVDAFGPASPQGHCIRQEKHRRGYCTEPGCPYSLTSNK